MVDRFPSKIAKRDSTMERKISAFNSSERSYGVISKFSLFGKNGIEFVEVFLVPMF